MFRVFTSRGGSKTLTNDHKPTVFPDESSNGEAHVHHVRMGILGAGISGMEIPIRLQQRG